MSTYQDKIYWKLLSMYQNEHCFVLDKELAIMEQEFCYYFGEEVYY